MNGTSSTNRRESVVAHQPAKDVFTAKSVAEIRAALADLQQKESTVTHKLDTLISAQKDLQRELGRLDLFRANLSTQAAKTRAISNGMLSGAAGTANRISASVKRLDLEQARVQETLTVVEQVRELKACVLGVSGSMGAPQDWETAAGYLSRASKVPDEVIDGAFAARVVPTAEVPDSPRVTLENASESLCGLFQREFDKAVKENDGAKITRFFKLSDVGLDVYGRYVCQGIATRARANLNAGTGGNQAKDGFFYANALTKLFEHIAQIVDGHGGLVERHYGPGKMNRVVERLQNEADMQGGIILDTWSDERRIDRQMTDIKSYAFTFLVHSFLQGQRGASGTPRSDSPAPGRNSEDEGVDMKEVDSLLGEMTMMLSKWSLYTRFITQKCSPGEESPLIPAFLTNSTLMKKIEERLLSPFKEMTTFFFRRSVEKAFQLDESPSDLNLNPRQPLKSTPPHVSSAIEDIMYILNKIVQQSLTTSQVSVVSSVVPTLSRVMGSDFVGMEQRKMRDEHYPRPVVQDSLPPEATVVAFIVLVNNVDVATSYIKQIVSSRLDAAAQPSLPQLFPGLGEREVVTATLQSFASNFTEKTSELLSDAISVLFNNVMKPRLRRILLDSFRDVEYDLDANSLSTLADSLGHDPQDLTSFQSLVSSRFSHNWEALTRPIARLMTESTYSNLLSTTANYLSKLLEKRLWTYGGRVNQAGASRLEHDINGIVKVVVSSGQKTNWKIREMFLRCAQICMVMNMDEEEWEELLKEGGAMEVADKLKPEERRRAREMLIED
ncbi:Golgi transport complex subunit 4 [Exophiala xenobiotica]|uniref:Conserved oligomeric Golgi complex subunit 4 n=1 Tax=Lithohypha guttulata TaxID=1690604 RepID=A0ABR0KCL4_9EURO|nr:Golgi transport complex subunit 4 [Lithohypha guttulata]KAK5320314.1 Golgi transport complex subunit 4 [Exophiala xenobiotica]